MFLRNQELKDFDVRIKVCAEFTSNAMNALIVVGYTKNQLGEIRAKFGGLQNQLNTQKTPMWKGKQIDLPVIFQILDSTVRDLQRYKQESVMVKRKRRSRGN